MFMFVLTSLSIHNSNCSTYFQWAEPCGEVQAQFVLIILLLMIILTFVYV